MYTHEETLELLQRAVTEKGDGHTSVCFYREDREDSEPICIVGHVLSYVGLLDEAIETDGVMQQPAILRQFTPAAVKVLDMAQRVQDDKRTWGEALIAAKEVAP